MRPFQECEARHFFGRSNQIRICLSLLGTNRSLAILGTSGAGKSSLIHAGLLPAIRRGIFAELPDWDDAPSFHPEPPAPDQPSIVIFTPGQRPLDSFASALVKASDGRLTEQEDHERLVNLLRSGTMSGDSFLRSIGWNPQAVLVLIADQLEELFLQPFRATDRKSGTSGAPESAFPGEPGFSHRSQVARFVDALGLISSARSFRTFTVLGMRSDFLKDCSDYPALADQIAASLFIVPALNWSEMEEAISKPVALLAQDANMESPMTPELVVQLLNQVTTFSDSLPLLQNFLADLYREAQDAADNQGNRQHEIAAFVRLLEQRLEVHERHPESNLLQTSLNQHGQRLMAESGIEAGAIRLFFSCLMRVDTGDRVLRRKLTRHAIAESTRLGGAVIQRLEEIFAKAEFPAWVTIVQGAVPESDEFTISHEALLRNWNLFEQRRGLPLSSECPATLRLPTHECDAGTMKKWRVLERAVSEIGTFRIARKEGKRLIRRAASTAAIREVCEVGEQELREIVSSTKDGIKHPLVFKARGKMITVCRSARTLQMLEPLEAGLANRARHLAEVIRDLRRRNQGSDSARRGLVAETVSDPDLLITDREELLLNRALDEQPRTPENFWLAHDSDPLEGTRELVELALKQKHDRRRQRQRLILSLVTLAALVMVGILGGVYFWAESERAKAESAAALTRAEIATALTKAEAAAALSKAEADGARAKALAEAALAKAESERAKAEAERVKAKSEAEAALAKVALANAETARAKAEAAQATANKQAAEEARQRDQTTARLFQEQLAQREEAMANSPRVSASDHLGPEPVKTANTSIDHIVSINGLRLLVGSSRRYFDAPNELPQKLGDLMIDPVRGLVLQQVELPGSGNPPRDASALALIYDPGTAAIALQGEHGPETILTLEKPWGIPLSASAWLLGNEVGLPPELRLAVGFADRHILFASGKLGQPLKLEKRIPLEQEPSWNFADVKRLSSSTYSSAHRMRGDMPQEASPADKPEVRKWRAYWRSDRGNEFRRLVEADTEIFLFPFKQDRCAVAQGVEMAIYDEGEILLQGHFGEIQSGTISSVSGWEDAACNIRWLAVGFDGGDVSLIKWPDDVPQAGTTPKRFAANDILILRHQGEKITTMQFSPAGGKHLAVGDASGRVVLWQDLETRFRKRLATVPFEAFYSPGLPRNKRPSKVSEACVTSLRFDARGDCLYAGFEDGYLCKIPIVVRSEGKWIRFFPSHGNELALYPKGLDELRGTGLVKEVLVAPKGFTPAWKRSEGLRQTALDREKSYMAARWDYSFTPLLRLRRTKVNVFKLKDGNPAGEPVVAAPLDYGPKEERGSFVLSDGIEERLGLAEDDLIRIEFQPFPPIDE